MSNIIQISAEDKKNPHLSRKEKGFFPSSLFKVKFKIAWVIWSVVVWKCCFRLVTWFSVSFSNLKSLFILVFPSAERTGIAQQNLYHVEAAVLLCKFYNCKLPETYLRNQMYLTFRLWFLSPQEVLCLHCNWGCDCSNYNYTCFHVGSWSIHSTKVIAVVRFLRVSCSHRPVLKCVYTQI